MVLNRPNLQKLFDYLHLSTKQLKEENMLQMLMDEHAISWNFMILITEACSEKELDPLLC